MKPLLLGSHPAVDFVNTAFGPDGARTETIGDGASFIEWLVAIGLLDAAGASKLKRRFGSKALETVAAEARAVREWARDWLDRWRVAPDDDYAAEIRFLNGLLSKDQLCHEVVALRGSFSIVERPRFETAASLIGLVASQIAALVTSEQPILVKHCAGEGCTLWFLDRTKAHRRLFCSPAACGNRAKVAAFRTRQRAQG